MKDEGLIIYGEWSKKVVTAKSSAKTQIIKNLRKNQTYYIRVRSYKIINGNKVYGAWSNRRSVKITK